MSIKHCLKFIVIAFLSVLLLPVLLIVGTMYIVFGALIYLLIWTVWGCRGRDVLVVYSDSPIWHDYMEMEVIEPLGNRAIVLNWSERKTWHRSISVWAFHRFGGHREFNPLVVVIKPFRMAKTFRFFQAFKTFKKGKPGEVDRLKSDLFSFLKM